MAFDEFGCVVLGNEPAGLWLLSELERQYAAVGEEARLGWVSLGGDPAPVCLPTELGKSFGVSPTATWSTEILTPRMNIPWTAKSVSDRFPELPAADMSLNANRDLAAALAQPTAPELAAIRTAIAKHPQLIGHAQGLWKAFGRTQHVLPESAVHYARFLTQLQWWSPEKDLSPQIQRRNLSTANGMESFKVRKPEGVSISFRDFGEITSRKWILNLDLRSLLTLCAQCPEFLQQLNLHWEPATLQALYPLRLRVEADAIPAPMPPMAVAFDTDLIPDPATEIWPMTLRNSAELRELTVWASAPGLVSLEAISERFREGLRRAQEIFPFLSRKLIQISMPLGMDSCFGEDERRSVCDALQESSMEVYHQTSFYTDTRATSISLLLPYLGCHLPYPIGNLLAARKIAAAMVPKRKRPPASPEVQPMASA